MRAEKAARSIHEAPPDGRPQRTCLTIQSNSLAVRSGLKQLMSMPPLLGLSEDVRGNVEIVLAEALNNVVEHAYRDGPGPIGICIDHIATVLAVSIHDEGAPMPGGSLPCEPRGPLEGAEDVPEGGFGWFLIHSLARDLRYERTGGTNHLCFAVQA